MAARTSPPVPLTRKEFYDLTVYCRTYALELARFDQHRVNLKECNRFNDWLVKVKRYDRLAGSLADMKPARPIARWQIIVILFMVWLILLLATAGQFDRNLVIAMSMGMAGTVILILFLPESLYGTTIELLDGKVLRVVNLLTELLNSGELGFTDAAYFKARENLQMAHDELRQQIDLAHR
ncbi:MAG: hypothetical protein IPK16_26165 [Anaerolineales bacterium]|nr:hypothetical protein [Anaerolineales bacterium]